MVPCPWSLIPGPWSPAPGLWPPAPGPWRPVPGPWSLAPGIWSVPPGPGPIVGRLPVVRRFPSPTPTSGSISKRVLGGTPAPVSPLMGGTQFDRIGQGMEADSLHPVCRPMPRMTLGYCPRREVMRVVIVVVIVIIIIIIMIIIHRHHHYHHYSDHCQCVPSCGPAAVLYAWLGRKAGETVPGSLLPTESNLAPAKM